MKVNVLGYELDTEKSYLDTDGDVVTVETVNKSYCTVIRQGLEVQCVDEGYISSLKEVVISESTVKKIFTPEVGKLYMFGDGCGELEIAKLICAPEDEDYLFDAELPDGRAYSYKCCEPLPEGWEIGR